MADNKKSLLFYVRKRKTQYLPYLESQLSTVFRHFGHQSLDHFPYSLHSQVTGYEVNRIH